MALADDLLPILREIRGIPGEFGLRPHTVALLSRSWGGTHSGDGDRTDTSLSLTEGDGQPPKVRWLNAEEMAVSMVDKSTVEIGPITADFEAREWIDDIRGDNLSTGDARYVVITGPKHASGANYLITKITVEKALHYMIQAQISD